MRWVIIRFEDNETATRVNTFYSNYHCSKQKKGAPMKCLYIIILYGVMIQGVCTQPDKTHRDPNVVRCEYTQEDIYRCYSKKCRCYGCIERRKECFFCGCPISEHTKTERRIQVTDKKLYKDSRR